MFIFHLSELWNVFQSQSSVSSAAIESRSAYYGTNHYSKFALEAVLYEILDKAAAALANALLQDVDYLQTHGVIDPSKMKPESLCWGFFGIFKCF